MAQGDIVYAQETYGELRPGVKQEWLLTNGVGGFAAGTVVGANTRRYHGLLVAATLPPVGRVVALSRLSEVVMAAGTRTDLSASYFRDELVGDGAELLRRFRIGGETVHWEYDVAGTKIFKELLVCWEQNACATRYRILRGARHQEKPLSLHLSPFVGLRDFHSLRHTGDTEFRVESRTNGTLVSLRDLSLSLSCQSHEGEHRFDEGSDWWYAHTYPMEKARGLDDREDLFTPGTFTLDMGTSLEEADITIWASMEPDAGQRVYEWEKERMRRIEGMKLCPTPTPTQQKLVRAASDFVVKRPRPDGGPGTTVIAGYPWFSDWGRDTFIALPGLFLTVGRYHEAGQVLSTFAHYVSEGMVPNRFDDYSNEPTYNTVDASLWFIQAAHEYRRVTRDQDTYESLLRPACEEIIDGYTRGTRFNIHVDPADGLVVAGDETTQLTWMDAKYQATVFTPRHGKAVEINALWYNALKHLGHDEEAERVRHSFVATFWEGQGHGLIDVVNEDGRDPSMRPNQIFAVSLPHSPLNEQEQAIVVDAVRRELLTPYGLRTLSRDHEKYEPRFTGPMFDRDRAYHNGTVWPWLIGPFLEAHLKINGNSPAARERARVWLRPLIDHLEREGCLGSISEVFDAEYPYRPGACFAQAWSVAEVLRLATELEM